MAKTQKRPESEREEKRRDEKNCVGASGRDEKLVRSWGSSVGGILVRFRLSFSLAKATTYWPPEERKVSRASASIGGIPREAWIIFSFS